MLNAERVKHANIDVFTYKGIKALQMYGVWDAFSELAQYVYSKQFTVIIELGADHGGLTNMLADHEISDNAIIHTFDINKERFTNLKPERIVFHHTDIHKNFETIGGLVRTSNRALVLCDGGDKAHEFNNMVKYLRPGDVIMAHDYSPNEAAHNENVNCGRWNWWEFNDGNIPGDPSLFKPLDCFEKYVWCIREKK
jgi:cephalosporin hydroxylase